VFVGDVRKTNVRHVDIEDPDRSLIAIGQDAGATPDHPEDRTRVAFGERDRNGSARTKFVALERFELRLVDQHGALGVLEFARPAGVLRGDRRHEQERTQH